jgi:hypothetical protein
LVEASAKGIWRVTASKQGDRVLGGGDGVGARRVEDEDAGPRRRPEVDVVDADAGPGDDPEPGGGLEHLLVDLRLAADDQGVDVADRGQERGAVGAVDVDHRRRLFEAGPSDRVDGVADDDPRAVRAGIPIVAVRRRRRGARRGGEAAPEEGRHAEEGGDLDDRAVGGRRRALAALDEEAGEAGRRVVAGVAEAVLDRVGDPVAEGDRGLEVGVEHLAGRKAVPLQPADGHRRGVLRAGGDDLDVVRAEQVDHRPQEGGAVRIRRQIGSRSVRGVDPVADLDRHVEAAESTKALSGRSRSNRAEAASARGRGCSVSTPSRSTANRTGATPMPTPACSSGTPDRRPDSVRRTTAPRADERPADA